MKRVLVPLAPGFEETEAVTVIDIFRYRTDRVVVDGRIITSRSPGTALEFALTLVEHLVGRTVSRRIAGDVLALGAAGVGVND